MDGGSVTGVAAVGIDVAVAAGDCGDSAVTILTIAAAVVVVGWCGSWHGLIQWQ